MKSAASRRNIIVAVIVAAAAFGLGPRRAEAQFGFGTGFDGFGFGFGFGFGAFSQVPKPESFLYQKALVDAGRDTQMPSRDVYANNQVSYINHIRTNASVERYPICAEMIGPTTAMGPTVPLQPRLARRRTLLRTYRFGPFPASTTKRTSSSGPAMPRRPESSKRNGRSLIGQATWS